MVFVVTLLCYFVCLVVCGVVFGCRLTLGFVGVALMLCCRAAVIVV